MRRLAIEQKTELNLILVKPCVLQGETYFNIMTTSEEYNIEEIIDWCGWGENGIRHNCPHREIQTRPSCIQFREANLSAILVTSVMYIAPLLKDRWRFKQLSVLRSI